MSYELNVNAGVTGQSSLSALTAATEKQSASTQALNNALYGASAAQEKYTLGAQKLAIEQAKIEQLTIQYRIALLGQTTATDGATASTERLSGATAGATGNVRNMTAALRGLEGGMPIRSAAMFLSQIQGINTAMQFAFPVFGAIALFGVAEQIVDKLGSHLTAWKQIDEAEKEATSDLKKYSDEAQNSLRGLRSIQTELAAHRAGPAVAATMTAESLKGELAQSEQRAAMLEKQRAALQLFISNTQGGSFHALTGEQRALVGAVVPDVETALNQDTPISSAFNSSQLKLAQTGLKDMGARIYAANTDVEQKRALVTQAGTATEPSQQQRQDRENSDAKKAETEALEKARRAAQEFASMLERATDAATKFQQGYTNKLISGGDALFQQTHDPFEANQGFGTQMNSRMMDNVSKSLTLSTIGQNRNPWSQDADVTGFYSNVQNQNRISDERQIAVLKQGSQERGTGMDPSAALQNTLQMLDLEVKIKAAHQDIWDIDQARFVAGLEAGKAEFDYAQKIIALKKQQADQQAQQARSLADGLFDALHSRTTGTWFKSFALNQGKQLFSNAATPILEGATHALGSVIPASAQTGMLGGLLHGTVFDSANAAPQQTANNTLETVKQVLGLRGDLKGIFTGNNDPNAQVPPGGAGSGGGSAFNPFMGSGGGLMGTGIGAGGGGTGLYGLPNTFNAFSPSLSSTGSLSVASSALAQFASGVSGGPSMALARFMGTQPPAGTVGYGADGTPHDDMGNPIVASTATQIGQGVSIAGAVASGTVSAIKSFEKGGASGALGGVAALAGMASLIPGAGLIAAPIAAIAGLFSAVLSTGPQQRAQQITDDINKGAYLAPTALNVTQGMNGTYEDFDARGNLRTSNLSAVPTVAEPYITKRTLNGQQGWYDAPGVVTAPYSGSATGSGLTPVSNAPGAGTGGITINVAGGINAMDSSSFHDFLQKPGNSMAVGDSLATHLQSHEGRASNAIRYVAGA